MGQNIPINQQNALPFWPLGGGVVTVVGGSVTRLWTPAMLGVNGVRPTEYIAGHYGFWTPVLDLTGCSAFTFLVERTSPGLLPEVHAMFIFAQAQLGDMSTTDPYLAAFVDPQATAGQANNQGSATTGGQQLNGMALVSGTNGIIWPQPFGAGVQRGMFEWNAIAGFAGGGPGGAGEQNTNGYFRFLFNWSTNPPSEAAASYRAQLIASS